jgi:hypothetical protein
VGYVFVLCAFVSGSSRIASVRAVPIHIPDVHDPLRQVKCNHAPAKFALRTNAVWYIHCRFW